MIVSSLQCLLIHIVALKVLLPAAPVTAVVEKDVVLLAMVMHVIKTAAGVFRTLLHVVAHLLISTVRLTVSLHC